MKPSPFRPALPEGWVYPSTIDAQHLEAELQREIPPGHLLEGIDVEAFAWRDHATDDVLFRHRNTPERFTIIHLSWIGDTEIDAQHPAVEFDGSFDGFLAREARLWGLTPPEP
ncbi:MAG: hypothetical protein Rubg2KO_01100 [Rubricoccaceae bacterium]